ncbi:MAG: hypothetical protein HYS38_00665, partial [Acidobacteria bacterium]|nr:hypothetical protein [Acidobacteriota bacterium]
MACHVDEATQFQKNPMAILLSDKYPQEQRGCEACHGPGSAHVEAVGEGTEEATERSKTLIYSFPRHSPQENAGQCLACHQKDEEKRLYGRSRHLGAGVSCVDCHDPHRLNPQQETARPVAALPSYFSVPQRAAEREWLNGRLLREKQPQLCYSCHRDIESQFQLPIRHRVNEGLVKCS